MDRIKYPMKERTERPLFTFLVKSSRSFDYYLYEDFDSAIRKAEEISLSEVTGLVYEIDFDTRTREYRGKNTFTVRRGKMHYEWWNRGELHLSFYVNAGAWLNPKEEWIEQLNYSKEEESHE